MAALRKIVGPRTGISYSSLFPSLLVLNRAIATKLFVGGLPLQTTEAVLSEEFSKYGQVIEAKIVLDRMTRKSKGFGFVTFASVEEGHTAIEEMNGKTISGRIVSVDYAKPNTNSRSEIPIARGPPVPASVPSN